jgi:hypothetical protein
MLVARCSYVYHQVSIEVWRLWIRGGRRLRGHLRNRTRAVSTFGRFGVVAGEWGSCDGVAEAGVTRVRGEEKRTSGCR